MIVTAMASERRAVERRGAAARLIGVGPAAAGRATTALLDECRPDHVVVVGIAGGLGDCAIGDVVAPAAVRDRRGGTYVPAPLPGLEPAGTLLTTAELILDAAELAALAADGVVALDMETAAVAAVCEERGVRWSVVRAISDRPRDGLVDAAVGDLAKADGTPDMRAVARYVARRPWRVVALARLGRDASLAARAAAEAAVSALR